MRLRTCVTAAVAATTLSVPTLATAPVAHGASAAAASTAAATSATTASRARTSPASATATKAMTSRLRTGAQSRYLGSGFSGLVLDESTGATLWSSRTGTTRMPASTQKVMTAITVLSSTSPNTQLVTRSYQSSAVPTNVYLKGAGDPSLTASKLSTLAQRTAASLRAQGLRSVTLYADATVFPAPTSATGWKRSYVGSEVQPVRGLTLAHHRGGANGTTAAASSFAASLKKAGISARYAGAAATSKGANELSASWSAPVSSLVAHMLSVSDNDYAEYLLRVAALEAGLRPTWTNSLAHQRAVLSRAGVPLTGYVNKDGSGLSRSNRMPVRALVAAVDHMWDDPAMRQVTFAYGAMPRSGQTGTLRSRFKAAGQRCAVGKVMAKTGTLGDAVALAGVARGSDGRIRAFAFIQNGNTRTASVRSAVDTMATAVVGCR
ncbi:D-alanyl-D-alanine carboxypeptidase/D-alanyl-D-alanine-endopeptidase [Mobilicoccus massiliensis]|uniref:D-alanyl-D-alanine carboxypeptidase/D-alanyl-D-alanine-endopeptidase n=1 Tax=Mobilicoccus massiliensis TaxID=1522310 RepID=UPI000590260B|nr:D-alanyl-D-alanine carboxypeptidase [Mobilicoccus massiliensis]